MPHQNKIVSLPVEPAKRYGLWKSSNQRDSLRSGKLRAGEKRKPVLYRQDNVSSFIRENEQLPVFNPPTPLKNAFQVIYFDFSIVSASQGKLEKSFNDYCGIVMDGFIKRYSEYYDPNTVSKVLASDDTGYKMKLINDEAHAKGYPLYLIIDEYDNFTNVILSEGGKEVFRNPTHASGFYREYFKLFKVMFSRVFLIGVSPVTLDDLSSGYNIDWNISQAPDFNYMLGFSESDVREMFLYYKGVGNKCLILYALQEGNVPIL